MIGPQSEVDRSPLSSAEVRNERSYASTDHIHFMGLTGTNPPPPQYHYYYYYYHHHQHLFLFDQGWGEENEYDNELFYSGSG
jgi:hypothetical protein